MNNQDDNHDGDQGVTGDARLWEGRQLGRGQEQQLWKVFILMLSFDDDDDDMVVMVVMMMITGVVIIMIITGVGGDRYDGVYEYVGDLNGEWQ